MNRNAKGAIAVGAATLLLLGGGGTFALWNASEDFAAGSVVSGELSLAPTVGATDGWFNQGAFDAAHAAWAAIVSNPAPEPVLADFPIADIATYQVVPEDLLVYVVDALKVTASGSNLFYTFTPSGFDAAAAALDGYTVTVAASDFTVGSDLPNSSTSTAVLNEFNNGAGNVAAGTKVYAFSSTTAVSTEFTMTLTVDFDNLNPQTEFNETLNLGALAYDLKQVVKN